MDHQRPNPDEVLAHIQEQESHKRRGRLKIFFGAAAGVGKTYAMLDAAQARRIEGVDVVAGYVEPHNRPETEALLENLEAIPHRMVEYRGVQLREFDLDLALARHPALILIDELAHSNAPGLRHTKRWQDVEELLEAGIDVYATVNVQHLESLNDVVAQITGTVVRETIPDSILEKADEVELIDISPDDLLKRLKEGKIYLPQQAEQAMKSFFRKGNLMALRELSLRRTAERVDEQMQVYRQDKAVVQVWPAGERILVCVSSSPLSTRLVRAAKRMATSLHADWMVVYVETPRAARLPEVDRSRVIQTLRLAEQLGATTTTLSGYNITEEVVAYARRQNVTKIIVGKPVHSTWRDMVFGSVLNGLVRQSGAIDVYAISGEVDSPQSIVLPLLPDQVHWALYLRTLLIVFACALLASSIHPYLDDANLIMIFLVGNVIVATRYGRGPSVFAAFLSVISFDFFFVTPYLTFSVSDAEYLITFGVMLLVSLIISSMTVRIKESAEAAREREQRTSSSYQMSREFANSSSVTELVQIALRHIHDVFDSQVVILLPDSTRDLQVHGTEQAVMNFTESERGVARWSYDRGQQAGWGTQTLPGSQGIYLPLSTPKATAGVLGLYPAPGRAALSPDQLHLLETFTNQTALAIERARLTEETEQAQLQIETERMRNSLLSSVSHDLRTPLAAIMGAASGILQHKENLDSRSIELAQIAYEEAERLNRLVGNLLDMTRLEYGNVQVEKEWQPLEEVVGITRVRLDQLLKNHTLKTHLPDDLPLVPIDSILIEQVLVNLLENAIKYTPPSSQIELSAWAEADQGEIVVEVADRGPGLPVGEEDLIFDKFYRVRPSATGGVGLGLTICRAIIKAHGGRLWASNRPDGGASFRFTLPLDGEPPEISVEDEQAR
ncbi:MAG: sensor histidine kinase KdpD [Chloroflexota bacterium]